MKRVGEKLLGAVALLAFLGIAAYLYFGGYFVDPPVTFWAEP